MIDVQLNISFDRSGWYMSKCMTFNAWKWLEHFNNLWICTKEWRHHGTVAQIWSEIRLKLRPNNLMLRVLKALPQTSSYFHNKEENKEMPYDWRTFLWQRAIASHVSPAHTGNKRRTRVSPAPTGGTRLASSEWLVRGSVLRGRWFDWQDVSVYSTNGYLGFCFVGVISCTVLHVIFLSSKLLVYMLDGRPETRYVNCNCV